MRRIIFEMVIALVWICAPAYGAAAAHKADASEKAELVTPRISPDEAFEQMKAGNLRFAADKAIHPHTDLSRLLQAGRESQGNHAFATVLSCSDSRVPVERIFDAGVMDIFVVRVAGNVCNVDQAGSIEYGLAHVNTPLLVVMGHTQCGAVTAVAQSLQGKAHTLERNIPAMIASIEPAVKRVMQGSEGMDGPNLIDKSIEENVWQAIENLFMSSPRTRELVTSDKVKVVGAVYDVGTGRVRWLPESKVYRLLGRTESDPKRAMNAFADSHGGAHEAPKKTVAIRAVAEHAAEPAHGEKPHGAPAAAHNTGDDHGAHPATKTAAKGHDDHAEEPKKAATAPAAKGSHGVKPDDKHGGKADESHGHGDKSDDKHGAAHPADKDEDDHGEKAAAEAAPAKSKPWMLIGIAGGIAVAGIVLLLVGMKSSKAAAAGAAGAEGAADAHGHAPAAH